MALWFQQRPCGARPGHWPWNQCKKDRERRQGEYIGSQPKGKTEIPGQSGKSIEAEDPRQGPMNSSGLAQLATTRDFLFLQRLTAINLPLSSPKVSSMDFVRGQFFVITGCK